VGEKVVDLVQFGGSRHRAWRHRSKVVKGGLTTSV
jgi:hypothetical protein